MASISLEGIYKIYPSGVEAVKDFTLEIEDKEFIIFENSAHTPQIEENEKVVDLLVNHILKENS